MRTMLYLVGVIIFMASLGHAADCILFDPEKIEVETSREGWLINPGEKTEEKYDDYIYDGKVVFRALKRFAPYLTCMIMKAKSNSAYLELLDPSIVFFSTAETIKENIRMSQKSPESFIDLEPKSLNLSISSGPFGPKKYFLQNDDNDVSIELPKESFDQLSLTKLSAIEQGQLLRINLSQLKKPEKGGLRFGTIPRSTGEDTCVVCLNKDKQIMLEPCNHVCLCEVCSKKIIKECPICKQKIASRKKVYL